MHIGILLSGCGVGDGSQIEEVILTYLALDKYQIKAVPIAPDLELFHTVNHLTEQVNEGETRNLLVEAARIGRGDILSLEQVDITRLDGLIIPGGLGVFKNLSSYIADQKAFQVEPSVEALIKSVHQLRKPIGAMCGGTVLLGCCIGNQENGLVLGMAQDAYKSVLEHYNVKVVNRQANEICVDQQHKLVTTPAFLGSHNLNEIMVGIDQLVHAMKSMINKEEKKMNRLELVLPSMEYKERVMEYKRAFIDNNERMDGCATLREADTFEEWYQTFQDTLTEETVRTGFVPATTYLAVETDGRLIGMIDIRHRLNEYLLNYGGHIGYSVRKSERRQGYATEMLGLALGKCVELGIKEVLVTCDKENIASAQTILGNGGRLEDECLEGEVCIQRYWISLD